MRLFLALLLLPLIASAQVTSTRVSTYDWRCENEAGEKLSDHQRFDTAFVACLNHAEGAFVQGGRYRITKAVVTAPASSVALSWTPPTQKTDGSPLTDLAGYRIHYGTSASALTQTVQAANPSLSAFIVDDLAPGTWYFAVSAYTSTAESDLSNVATKIL